MSLEIFEQIKYLDKFIDIELIFFPKKKIAS